MTCVEFVLIEGKTPAEQSVIFLGFPLWSRKGPSFCW